jgi:hypothetical protein
MQTLKLKRASVFKPLAHDFCFAFFTQARAARRQREVSLSSCAVLSIPRGQAFQFLEIDALIKNCL